MCARKRVRYAGIRAEGGFRRADKPISNNKYGGKGLRKGIFGFLSVCVIVLCAAVMTIPISGIMGIMNAEAADEQPISKLRIGFMQSIDSLNPYVGLNDASYIFYGLVYDAMDVIDNDMNPWPDLIKGPDISDCVFAVPEGYDSDPNLA